MSRAVVDLVVNVIDKGSGNLKKVSRELKGVDQAQSRASRTADRIKGGFSQMAIAAGTVGAALFATKKAFDFSREGAQLNQLEKSFNQANAEIFKTPNLLRQLKDASRGTISETVLMSGVMTLTAGTTEQYGRALAAATPRLVAIAKASSTLNPRLGTTEQLYDKLAFAIKRTSKLRADDLGLMISMEKATRELHPALQNIVDSYEDLDDQQRFLNEALIQGDKLIKQAGGSADSTADAYDRLAVDIGRFIDSAKQLIALGVEFIAPEYDASEQAAIEQYNADILRVKQALEKGLITFEEYIKVQTETALGTEESRKAYRDFVIELDNTWRAVDAVDEKLMNFVSTTDDVTEATEDLTKEQKKLISELEAYEEQNRRNAAASESARRSAELQDKQLIKSIQNQQDYNEELEDTEEAAREAERALNEFWKSQAAQSDLFARAMKDGFGFFNEQLDELGPKMVTWGGRTADQNRLLSDMQDEVDGLNRKIADAQAAPEIFGGVDEAAEDIEKWKDRINELTPAIARLQGIQGMAGMVIQEATIDQEALTRSLFDNIIATAQNADALKEYDITGQRAIDMMLEFGVATGQLNQQQADYIAKGIEVTNATDQIRDAFLRGILSAEGAAAALLTVAENEGITAQQAIEARTKTEELGDSLDNMAGFYEAQVEFTVAEEDKRDIETLNTQLDGIADFYEAQIDSNASDEEQDIINLNTELDQLNTARGAGQWFAEIDSNAIDIRDKQVNPLQTAVDAWIEGSPYTAHMEAEVEDALANMEEVQTVISGLAKLHFIDFQFRTVGSPPTLPPIGSPPGRQHGGLVFPPNAYIVGEREAEVFIPPSPGRIEPLSKIQSGDVIIQINGGDLNEVRRVVQEEVTQAGIQANRQRRTI